MMMPKEQMIAAAETGDLAEVARLTAEDAYLVNATGECDMTPLLIAVRDGNMKLATFLINRGADLDMTDGEHRAGPLGWAAFYGRADMVELLIDAGADPAAANTYGDTPMKCAQRGKAGEWKPFAKNATKKDYDAIIALLADYCDDCDRPSGF